MFNIVVRSIGYRVGTFKLLSFFFYCNSNTGSALSGATWHNVIPMELKTKNLLIKYRTWQCAVPYTYSYGLYFSDDVLATTIKKRSFQCHNFIIIFLLRIFLCRPLIFFRILVSNLGNGILHNTYYMTMYTREYFQI